MHTPEQRDTHPLCGAKKRSDGTRCRAFAGQGTTHPGVGRCKYHGGSTASHRKHAAVVEAKKEAGELGAAIDASPGQLMAASVRLTAGALAWAMKAVSEADGDMDSIEASARRRVFAEERERAARIAKAAADLGVDERLAALAEDQASMVAQLLEAVAHDLKFTDEQRKALGPAIRRRLALMEQNANGDLIDGSPK